LSLPGFRLRLWAPLCCARGCAELCRSVAMGDPNDDASQEDSLYPYLPSFGSSQPTTRLPAGPGDSAQFTSPASLSVHAHLLQTRMAPTVGLLPPLLERQVTVSNTPYLDSVLGDDNLLDHCFQYLTELQDRTRASCACKLFASYRPRITRERLVNMARHHRDGKLKQYGAMRRCVGQVIWCRL
jgi:hypothetical protein